MVPMGEEGRFQQVIKSVVTPIALSERKKKAKTAVVSGD
jgi:hypothetical protein